MGIKTKTDSNNATVPPHEVYRTLMLELKLRLQRAEFVLRAPSPVTGLASLDAEFCFLQIRRIIEIITFTAALRDEARYKKLRELQKTENNRDHGDYAKDWEAAEIQKRLSEISPYFLPRPIKRIVKTEIAHHVDNKSLSVTHGRLIEIYKQSSSYLHAKNPLGKDFQTLVNAERTKYDKARKEIRKSLQFIRSIIWHHAAIGLEWSEELDPREPANPQKAWIVDFGQEDKNEIMIVLAEAK